MQEIEFNNKFTLLEENVKLLMPTYYIQQNLDKVKPIWCRNNLSKRYEDDYYEFVVMAEKVDKNISEHRHTFSNNTNHFEYKCHICNLYVPKAYRHDHNNSIKHENCLKLADIAFTRLKHYIDEPKIVGNAENNNVPTDMWFCKNCATIVPTKDRLNHANTKKHKTFVKYDELLTELVKIYNSSITIIEETSLNNNKICAETKTDFAQTTENTNKTGLTIAKPSFNDNESEFNGVKRLRTHISMETEVLQVIPEEKKKRRQRRRKAKQSVKFVTTIAPDNRICETSEQSRTITKKQEPKQKISINYLEMEKTDNPNLLKCKICNVKVPNSFCNLSEHFNGLKHNNNNNISNSQFIERDDEFDIQNEEPYKEEYEQSYEEESEPSYEEDSNSSYEEDSNSLYEENEPSDEENEPSDEEGCEPLYVEGYETSHEEECESSYDEENELLYEDECESLYEEECESLYQEEYESSYEEEYEPQYDEECDPSCEEEYESSLYEEDTRSNIYHCDFCNVNVPNNPFNIRQHNDGLKHITNCIN